MTDATAELAQRYFDEAFTEGNVDVIDEIFAEEVRVEDEIRTRAEVKEPPRRYNDAFEDLTIAIEETVSDGDRAAIHWTGTGHHTGEYRGLGPTGEEITVSGLSLFIADDGHIVEYVTILDSIGLIQQLDIPIPFEL